MAICGIAHGGAVSAGNDVARCLDALSLGPEWKRDESAGRGFALGVTSAIESTKIGVLGPITVCCDADLWNATELLARARIAQPNVALAIAALYEQLGEKVLHELRGAFALAIWDTRDSRLLI